MNIDVLSAFLFWCVIINGALLLCWSASCALFPDFVYRSQSKWFPITKEQHSLLMYSYLGLFKVFFLVFNLVPYIALRIIS